MKVHFQVSNQSNGKSITAFELYVYATDAWSERIYGESTVYHWTTQKNLAPGKTVYSDYVTIPNRNEISKIYCGIHKVKYADGTIVIVDNVQYSNWEIK